MDPRGERGGGGAAADSHSTDVGTGRRMTRGGVGSGDAGGDTGSLNRTVVIYLLDALQRLDWDGLVLGKTGQPLRANAKYLDLATVRHRLHQADSPYTTLRSFVVDMERVWNGLVKGETTDKDHIRQGIRLRTSSALLLDGTASAPEDATRARLCGCRLTP